MKNVSSYSTIKRSISLCKVISIWIVCTIFCLIVFFDFHKNDPVGLFVVHPDTEFFQCAKEVHGNYQFYYDGERKVFMFIRNDELCSVNTMVFREHYIEMFGRKNEIFIGE